MIPKSWVFTILLLSLTQAQAQTCCSGGVPLSNNLGGLPLSTQSTWQFSFSADLNVLRSLKEGSIELDDDSRQRKTFSFLLKSSYSFTDKLFIESLITWVQQERSINQPNGFTDYDRTRGLGDLAILINFNYLSFGKFKFIAGAGPKMPTGRADLPDADGLTLNSDLQPGSGAWDGIILHRIQGSGNSRPSQLYFLNLTYRQTGTNSEYLGNQQYRFGNEYQMLLGISDQFLVASELFSVGLNVRFRSVKGDQFNHQPMPNTGGRWLFIMPVIAWNILPNLSINLNGEFPLYTYVEGTQISPSFRINGGIYFSFSNTIKKMLNKEL